METKSDGNDEISIADVKDMRQQLEARIHSLRTTQLELLSSLQSHLVPNIVSSIDLSLKVVSSINNRPFTPTPPLPEPKPKPNTKKPLQETHPFNPDTLSNRQSSPESKTLIPTKIQNPKQSSKPNPAAQSDGERFCPMDDDSGSPLSVVRSMVAVCLLERVPFSPIDSSTVLRKLENDQTATPAEKAALRELGGESGEILAVEMALRSMAEDNGGVELEEFVVSGKSRVMVLGIDRTRLLKELPESKQESSSAYGNACQNQSQNQKQVGASGIDVNGGIFGMGGPFPRPFQDMWMGANDHRSPGMPPLFPGSGPPGALMGPRGVPRVMGIMGMPRGIGLPPLQRPLLGQNAAIGGPNSIPQKIRSEEDDMKDLEALLNKKSFRELQKSKTGEELLDLIHRPTARETAVAAKVCDYSALDALANISICIVMLGNLLTDSCSQ